MTNYRKAESRRTVLTTFLSYYMLPPKGKLGIKLRHSPIAILPGTGDNNSELPFLMNNVQPASLIHCYENNYNKFGKLLLQVEKLSKERKISETERPVVHLGDVFESVFKSELKFGAIWADTTGFLNSMDRDRIDGIIKYRLLKGGVFAITVARDGYRGHRNERFDESLLDPKTLLKVKFSGGASPMAFIVGRKR